MSVQPAQPVSSAPQDRAARAREALRRAEEHTGARTLSIVPPAAPALGATDGGQAVRSAVQARTASSGVSPVTPSVSAPGAAAPETGLTSTERPALPVPAQLRPLVPEGLRRGSAAVVTGSTSLLLAMLAEVTHDGGWVAVVGAPAVGLVAAAQMGVALDRLVLVPRPGVESAVVVAALLDGMDVVVVGPDAVLVDSDRRRLTSRARERASVILATTSWQGAHMVLATEHSQWSGLGQGSGRLSARRLTVSRSGRGTGAARRLDVCFTVGDAVVPPPLTAPGRTTGLARVG